MQKTRTRTININEAVEQSRARLTVEAEQFRTEMVARVQAIRAKGLGTQAPPLREETAALIKVLAEEKAEAINDPFSNVHVCEEDQEPAEAPQDDGIMDMEDPDNEPE